MSITGDSRICLAMMQRLLLIQLRCFAALSWVLKRWRSTTTILPCATYQEFYDVLLRIEDSDKMPTESEEEEESSSNLKKHDKGNGQLS